MKASADVMRNKVTENTIHSLVQAMVNVWRDRKDVKPAEYYGRGGEYTVFIDNSGNLSVNIKG